MVPQNVCLWLNQFMYRFKAKCAVSHAVILIESLPQHDCLWLNQFLYRLKAKYVDNVPCVTIMMMMHCNVMYIIMW
jgi:hypothetical protein